MVKQDPNYFVDLNGTEYFKLTFWIKNDDLTRFDILMNGKERVSQSGKNQWINAIGQLLGLMVNLTMIGSRLMDFVKL